MVNDERYVRKGYKIWDTYSDREVQELNYRSQSDDMCELLNKKEEMIQRLELENEDLRKQVESSETTSNATSNYNAFLESKITTLEQENRQLRQFINKGRRLSVKEIIDNINENELLKKKIKELKKDNNELKDRLYDFEKRKIIEESAIDEDVIPKVKLLRAELFGEKYE